PFGPESWNPDRKATDLVRDTRAVVAIGAHTAAYIEQHTGVRPTIVHPPMYGQPPYPRFGDFQNGWLLMINPWAVKGLPIFLELPVDFLISHLRHWPDGAQRLLTVARCRNCPMFASSKPCRRSTRSWNVRACCSCRRFGMKASA